MPAERNPKNRINTIGFDGESSFGFSAAATTWSGPCSVAAMSVMGCLGGSGYGERKAALCDRHVTHRISKQCRSACRTDGRPTKRQRSASSTQRLVGSKPTGITRPQRAAPSPRLVMVLGVVFCGLVPVMGRMQSMRMRDVRVMARLFVIARFVVLRRFAMMVGGSLMMLGCDLMVAATLVGLGAHVDLLSFWSLDG